MAGGASHGDLLGVMVSRICCVCSVLLSFAQPTPPPPSNNAHGGGHTGAYSATLGDVGAGQLGFGGYSRHLVGSPALGSGGGQIACDQSGRQFGKAQGEDWFGWGGPSGRAI